MESVTRFWSHEAQNIRCVREADYDAALGEIAALEQSEKLAQETVTLALSTGLRVSRENEALQQRLTVQDQRVDDLTALVMDALDAFKYDPRGGCMNPGFRFVKPWAERAMSVLKPTAEAESHE